MTKKFLSLLLSVVMVMGLLPVMSVSAESVTHYTEDFETWNTTTFNAGFLWEKATTYILANGTFHTSSSKAYDASLGSNLGAEVLSMPGYDETNTNVFKLEVTSDASKWPTKAVDSNPGQGRFRVKPTVTIPTTGIAVQEFRLYIPEGGHDIQKFSFGPIIKDGNSIGEGLKATSVNADYNLCGNLSTGWNKITAVSLLDTLEVILYLNDECIGYKKYEGRTDKIATYGLNELYVNSYKVTDWVDKYLIIDDYNIYSAPDATKAFSVYSDASDISANANPTVEFTQKVLGKTINSDGSVPVCATVEFTNMSDGNPVDIASTSISEDGKKLTITPVAALEKGTQYKITVSDVKDMYDQPVEACEFTFTTMEDSPISLTSAPTFTKEDLFNRGSSGTSVDRIGEAGYYNVSYTIKNESTKGLNQSVIMLTVLKEDTAIKGFQFEEGNLAVDEELTFNGGFYVDDPSTQTIETYVWDSLYGMTPLTEKYTISASGKTSTAIEDQN